MPISIRLYILAPNQNFNLCKNSVSMKVCILDLTKYKEAKVMNIKNNPDPGQAASVNLRDLLAEYLTPTIIRVYPEDDLEDCEQEELPF